MSFTAANLAAASAAVPGKPPILVNTSPSGLAAFAWAAKLYFKTKKIEDNESKIQFAVSGLLLLPELDQW